MISIACGSRKDSAQINRAVQLIGWRNGIMLSTVWASATY
jgi:hypothetical protein